MNLPISLVIILSFVLFFTTPAISFSSNSPDQALLRGSSLSQKQGILVLHVQGTPYQMGYQQGVLLREHIKVIYWDYLVHKLKIVTKTWWKYWLAYHFFKSKAMVLDKYIPQEYRDEMRGIADGSGFRYIDILMMNTWLDVISDPHIFSKEFKTCGNFVTLNEGMASGLVHGRNLSWPSEGILEKHTVAIFYKPQTGNSLVGLTWPGAAGFLTGMNSKGVTIGEASVGTIDASLKGIPVFILLHKILQDSDTIYDAVSDIASSQRTTGYNITISDGKSDKACLLEFSAGHYSVAFARHGMIFSTNHYQDPAMFETMKPVYQGQNIKLEDSSSYKRLMRIKGYIQKSNGAVDPSRAKDILSDDLICTEGTFLSAVLQPKILKFSVAVGRANILNKKFVDFDLGKEFNITPERPSHYPDPLEFYAYQASPIHAEQVLTKDTATYKKYAVTFDSIVNTSLIDHKVYLIYYEPKNVKHFPVVMMLPHYAGSVGAIEGQFALDLIEEGIGVVVVNSSAQVSKLGRQWLAQEVRKNDARDTFEFFRSVVTEARQAMDWVEIQPGVERDHLGILGLSFGAVVAPIVVAVDGRIKSAVYLLGGGDIAQIIANWKRSQGIMPTSGAPVQYSLVDPLTFAFKAKDVPTLMYNSVFDDIISRPCALKLWRALQEPFIYWVPASHYSAILFLGNAEDVIARHFDKTLKSKPASSYMSPLDVFTRDNFLKNQELQVTGGGRYSTEEKRVRLGLRQDHVLGSPFFIGAEGTGHLAKDERYRLKGQGFDAYGGMMVAKNTKMTLKFENENITMYRINDSIAPSFFQQEAGYHHVNTADLLLERSTLNDPYYPTQGNNEKLEWDRSAKGLGSDYDFDRIEGQWRYYVTPGQGHFFTYAFRSKIGWVNSYGSSDGVPYFERMFAGGSGTLRGYGNFDVGPRDTNNLPLGGDLMWVNSAEVRFPIYRKVVGAYFIDVGDVWAHASDINPHTLKSSTGVSLLYPTPWGVARLDLGFRTSKDKDAPSSTIEATFGVPF